MQLDRPVALQRLDQGFGARVVGRRTRARARPSDWPRQNERSGAWAHAGAGEWSQPVPDPRWLVVRRVIYLTASTPSPTSPSRSTRCVGGEPVAPLAEKPHKPRRSEVARVRHFELRAHELAQDRADLALAPVERAAANRGGELALIRRS